MIYSMRRILLLITGLILSFSALAQKTADIGIWGGGSGYLGDLENTSLNDFTFPTIGAYFRYNFHERAGVRAMLLSGNMAAEGIIQNHPWEFKKNVRDFSLQAEINFLRYSTGNRKAAFSSYLTGGIGLMNYRYEYDQAFMHTITPNTNKGTDDESKNVIAPSLPFGMGFKFNVGKRLGLGVEYQMRKLLDDRLDNLDDPLAHINNDNIEVTYRDRLHNNDWAGFLGLHLTYKIFLGKVPCPAYD
ncbi:outer membrane protein beta-barrel domain [Bacteroidales bacterium 6E]|nr:outer membrane protein beta-barrel domain [Bacteroidales bacterium 6E]